MVEINVSVSKWPTIAGDKQSDQSENLDLMNARIKVIYDKD